MSSAWTVRQAVDRIVEAGLVDPPTVERNLEPAVLDQSMDYFGGPGAAMLASLLSSLEIAYIMDYKAFRGAHEGGRELYRRELESIAAHSHGLLTVTDVELVDADRRHLLRFRCNGEPQEWPITHRDDEDEDLEAQLTFGSYLLRLKPAGSTTRWHHIDPMELLGEPLFYVLGEPARLRRLGEAFGVTFVPEFHGG